MSYYYPYPPPPPPPRHSYRKWILAAGGIFIAVIGFVAIVVAIKSPSAPSYSPAEQKFLTAVRESQPGPWEDGSSYIPWPSDAELVKQGHALCELDSAGGHYDRLVRKWGYPSWQGVDLDSLADNILCSQNSVFAGQDI
jgi:hypothetical protein